MVYKAPPKIKGGPDQVPPPPVPATISFRLIKTEDSNTVVKVHCVVPRTPAFLFGGPMLGVALVADAVAAVSGDVSGACNRRDGKSSVNLQFYDWVPPPATVKVGWASSVACGGCGGGGGGCGGSCDGGWGGGGLQCTSTTLPPPPPRLQPPPHPATLLTHPIPSAHCVRWCNCRTSPLLLIASHIPNPPLLKSLAPPYLCHPALHWLCLPLLLSHTLLLPDTPLLSCVVFNRRPPRAPRPPLASAARVPCVLWAQ